MTKEMKRKSLLLIDDDPVVTEILLERLVHSCPMVAAEAVLEPVAKAGYDIYVIDLNFAGQQDGVRLAESISASTPEAAIFMLSSHLDVQALKRAMGVQCRGAFDKREPEDISALIRAIAEEASRELLQVPSAPAQRRSLIGEMAALIREWNRRMAAEQSR
jgi:DNA-binding NarL/FixJ family response regulator